MLCVARCALCCAARFACRAVCVVLGRAGVVRAPSSIHPLMNVVRIDIIDIKSDRSVLTKVESGIKWSYTSPEAEELLNGLLNELRGLSKTL